MPELGLPFRIMQSPSQQDLPVTTLRPDFSRLQHEGTFLPPPPRQPQTAPQALPAIIRMKKMAAKRFSIRQLELSPTFGAIVKANFAQQLLFADTERRKNPGQHIFGRRFARNTAQIAQSIVQTDKYDFLAHALPQRILCLADFFS